MVRQVPAFSWSSVLPPEHYSKPKIFLSLGGNFQGKSFLEKMNKMASILPQYTFIIAPRTAKEMRRFAGYPHLYPVAAVEPHILIANAQLTVTKAGFQTVSEALAAGKRLLLWDLPTHSEISETAQFLAKQKITPPPISAKESPHILKNAIQNALKFPAPQPIQANGVEQIYAILEKTFWPM